MIKDELAGKVMTKLFALTSKIYACRMSDKKFEDKWCKGTQKCVATEYLISNYTKICSFEDEIIFRKC